MSHIYKIKLGERKKDKLSTISLESGM